MYPVFIKTGYRHFLLQYGKRVATSSFSFTSSILRFANDDSKSKSDDDDIKLPPEPTTCCMSGCANCVWIEYAETIARLMDGNTERVRELVLKRIEDPNLRMFLSVELKSLQYKIDLDKNKNSSESSTSPSSSSSKSNGDSSN